MPHNAPALTGGYVLRKEMIHRIDPIQSSRLQFLPLLTRASLASSCNFATGTLCEFNIRKLLSLLNQLKVHWLPGAIVDIMFIENPARRESNHTGVR